MSSLVFLCVFFSGASEGDWVKNETNCLMGGCVDQGKRVAVASV